MYKNIGSILFLVIFSWLIYSYGMGGFGLTDPDETFYAQTAKEMIETNNLVTPFMFGHPQFEKPVLFYWLIISAFKLFGMTEFAARLWPVLFGVLGVVITFLLGKLMFSRKIGFYAASMLATSFLYIGLSKGVLTDIVLTVFILLSMFFFYSGYTKTYRTIFYILAYVFAGLAVLTKGPVGIIMPFFVIAFFFVIQKKWNSLRKFFGFWQGWLAFLAVTLPWYVFASLKYGHDFIYGFFVHENIQRFFTAEHRSFNHWYFYLLVIFLGMFPWSNLLPFMFRRKKGFSPDRLFLYCWITFTLVFFTFAQSKLASYILPLFPALCLLFASQIADIESSLNSGKKFKLVFSISILLTLVFLGAFVYSLIWIKGNFPALFIPSLVIGIVFAVAICSSPVLLFKRKVKGVLIINFAAIVIVIVLIFNCLAPHLEGSFSDRMLSSRLLQEKSVKKEILCDKMFVRGVHYYTGWPVAVINYDKHTFYTSHPISILSKDSEIEKFFSSKKNIVCVIKEQELERINNITNGERKNRIIYRNGERIVVISEPLSRK